VTYDDERVVALLKDAVPDVPDSPGRVDAVRRLAARQKAFVPVQALGAAASVVLLLAAVAAVARPPSRQVRPVADPLGAMASAVREHPSGRFALRASTDSGKPGGVFELEAVGAFTQDGDVQVDPVSPGSTSTPSVRVVDGVAYRSLMPGESAPPGTRWVRLSAVPPTAGAFVDVRTVSEHLRGVRFVRRSVVRCVDVVEYAATRDYVFFDPAYLLGLTFALDADGLPRRVATAIELGGVRTSFSLEYYDFGARVVVAAPPGAEVVDESQLQSPAELDTGTAEPCESPGPRAGWSGYPSTCVEPTTGGA